MIKSIVDLRASFGPARDQGPRPTCLSFAASDTHAAARPGWNLLSVEWAYYHALKRDGGLPEDGATMTAMLTTIKLDGQPVETDWPYSKTPIINGMSWNPPAAVRDLFYRDHGNSGGAVNGIIDQLNAGSPVLITMTLSDAFYIPSSEGLIDANEPVANINHALVAAGHGSDGPKGLILVRNSWGEGWGLKGYAWVSVDYLTPRLTGAAILTREL